MLRSHRSDSRAMIAGKTGKKFAPGSRCWRRERHHGRDGALRPPHRTAQLLPALAPSRTSLSGGLLELHRAVPSAPLDESVHIQLLENTLRGLKRGVKGFVWNFTEFVARIAKSEEPGGPGRRFSVSGAIPGGKARRRPAGGTRRAAARVCPTRYASPFPGRWPAGPTRRMSR